MQIFGDAYGNVVALGERECSVQRRHQKIIEESPCVEMTRFPQLRAELHASAVEIGKLLSYQGAATIEYIYSPADRRFYFLEINTRLQVEHPVTEMVYGIDLVSLQMYIAGGGDITRLERITSAAAHPPNGHAIEMRLCAEEPGAEFAPRTGYVRQLAFPLQREPGFRLDSGIQSGSNVSIHFDPMLAKLIVHAPDRSSAIANAKRMLESTPTLGVVTNTSFMRSCLNHPTFFDGSYSTSLIPANLDALLAEPASQASATLCHGTGDIPSALVVPAFLFFHHLRQQLRTPRLGLKPLWRVHGQDSSFSQVENYELTLPDGAGTWNIMLSYAALPSDTSASEPAFEVRLWRAEKAQETEKAVAKGLVEKAKKKASAKKGQDGAAAAAPVGNAPTFVQSRTAATARFYASLLSRAGTEGRDDDGAGGKKSWPLGVAPDETHTVRVAARSVQVHSQRAFDAASPGWVNGTVRYELTTGTGTGTADGAGSSAARTGLAVISSDESWAAHEDSSQGAWIWSPELAGQVRVVRRALRVYAGRLEEGQSAGGSDGE